METKEQIEGDKNKEIEYTYDKQGNLVQVKSSLENEDVYKRQPHGDVVQLTDDSGKVIKDYEYDSFGNEVNPDKKDENPFRYCGEYYDRETETIYLRARYYQPYLGRFLTRDTYTGEEDDPLSLHLYTYCGNDGVNKADQMCIRDSTYGGNTLSG